MSDLSNILNPENSRNKSLNAPHPEAGDDATPSINGTKDVNDTRIRQPDNFASYEHEPHPDCPDTLACLPDTDGRPQHTLPVILRCAILGSPRRRLTIREIYAAMEEKYSYYKTAGPTWKQSVRHHLSLNRLFERQPRPVTDPGFGSYWTVNLAAPPGTKRPRKRGRGNKDPTTAAGASGQASAPVKPINPTTSTARTTPTPPVPESIAQSVKRRGRPRKPSSSIARGSTPLSSSHDEDDDHEMPYETGPPDSDDEYDSEDDLVNQGPYDRRESLGLTPYAPSRPTQLFSLPPIASLDKSSESVVERMQNEIASLRRQSAEAVSVSLRLSEQLAQAQAEVSRSRAAVRDLEDMLEDETMRRRDAERQASEEAKRRRIAEEAFGVGVNRSPDRNRPV